MAERLKFIPEQRTAGSFYPWSDWTDGSAWRINEGEDFTVAAKSMRDYLYGYAARHNLKVTALIEQRDGHDTIAFQFRTRHRKNLVLKPRKKKSRRKRMNSETQPVRVA